MPILEMCQFSVVDWNDVCRKLAEERDRLLEIFQGDPTNIRLAPQIVRLDDQILDFRKRAHAQNRAFAGLAPINARRSESRKSRAC